MQNQFFNPFEFLTTPWGTLPIGSGPSTPGAFNPTDLKEMEKRINELKAVEQWLSLNLNLLKTTIQGLEVQRGTLAAIAAFSESISKSPDSDKKKPVNTDANPFAGVQNNVAVDQAAFWWDSMQKQFEQMMVAAQASAQSIVEPKAKTSSKKSTDKSQEPTADSGSQKSPS